MDNNLLIIGSGIYGVVAYELACEMNCFNKIDFVDDGKSVTPNGKKVICGFKDIKNLGKEYNCVIVAIGNPEVRLNYLEKIQKETNYKIATLISPRAYVSPTAKVMCGSIVEPMAVIQSLAEVHIGCIISANAVVNHSSVCCMGVHIDCNATVKGYTEVPKGTKVESGEVYGTNN